MQLPGLSGECSAFEMLAQSVAEAPKRVRAWLGFSARFRSFITCSYTGKAWLGGEKGPVEVVSGSWCWKSPTLAGFQLWSSNGGILAVIGGYEKGV